MALLALDDLSLATFVSSHLPPLTFPLPLPIFKISLHNSQSELKLTSNCSSIQDKRVVAYIPMRLRDELANGLVGFPVLLLMLGIAVPHGLAGRAPLQLLLPAAHLADCASLLRLLLLQQMLHPCFRMMGS